MGNDLGVGLTEEHIALGLQGCAEFFVVFNDAVVYQGHPTRLFRRNASFIMRFGVRRTVAEMGVGIVHGGCAVSGPTGMGYARAPLNVVVRDLRH